MSLIEAIPGPPLDTAYRAEDQPQAEWITVQGALESVFISLAQKAAGVTLVQGGLEFHAYPLYVVRAGYQGGLFPGKAGFHSDRDNLGAYIPGDANEIRVTQYDVLVGKKDDFEWRSQCGPFNCSKLDGFVPVIAGHRMREEKQELLYIARANVGGGSVQCGYVAEDGIARVPFDGESYDAEKYEVLVHSSSNRFAARVMIGNYSIRNQRLHVRPGDRYSAFIHFTTPLGRLPMMVTSLAVMDVGRTKEAELRLRTHVEHITQESFVCDAESWADSILYRADVNWAAIEEPTWQGGVFQSTDVKEWAHQGIDGILHHRINFPTPFADGPPMLFVAFNHLDVWKAWAMRTYATDVGHTGFDISIVKTHTEEVEDADEPVATKIRAASVGWVAVPGNAVAKNRSAWVGRFSTGDIGAQKFTRPNEKGWAGHIDFGVRFRRTPKIMVGINHFNFSNQRNPRLKVNTSKITTSGMDWEIKGWNNTILHGASISYLAVDSIY